MREPKMGKSGGMKAPKMHEAKEPKMSGAPQMKGFGGNSMFKEPSSAKKLAGFKAPKV